MIYDEKTKRYIPETAIRKSRPWRRGGDNPEQLMEMFNGYVEWAKENPIKKEDFIKGGPKGGEKITTDSPRALSWNGFYAWLATEADYSIRDLDNYRYNRGEEHTEFIESVNIINSIIHENIFPHAQSGVYNANLSARYLGIGEPEIVQQKTPKQLDWSKVPKELISVAASQYFGIKPIKEVINIDHEEVKEDGSGMFEKDEFD